MFRLAVVAIVAVVATFVASLGVYRMRFGLFPPTCVNLLYWVDPNDPECGHNIYTIRAERAPGIGTNVSIDDMCFPRRPSTILVRFSRYQRLRDSDHRRSRNGHGVVRPRVHRCE